MTRFAAVVLAGGAARRLGGRDKPMVPVAGVPMISRVLAAVHGAGRGGSVVEDVIVVGPRRDGLPDSVRVVQEEPPGGGPAAAVAAGLGLVRAEVVALLAADLPHLDARAVATLLGAIGRHDGAVFVDDDGRRQLLCGAWRTAALKDAVGRIGEPAGKSMRALVDGLDVREVRWGDAGAPPYFDCDTEDDLRNAERA
ncbi:NTP transferase domain-containing protein [Dactylosporangium fulvum]|uniref:NTP transferase domain-containing protein n=1 Tax=Dactylosporangium fulvum TaxID=53359 RepID=A0ABY5VYW6_9ACTN|nr:NTP transferase domain-containing protein [Dactylosporangium fulvum]